MSELAKFVAQIGGALSAQGAGGSQGLQQYMAALAAQQSGEAQRDFAREQQLFETFAKRQADRSAQEFTREQTERQETFTLERDRLNREHEQFLQEQRLAAQKIEQNLDYESSANAIWLSVQDDPKRQALLTDWINRTDPGAAQSGVLLDPSYAPEARTATLPLILNAVKLGATLPALEEKHATQSEDEQWYQAFAPGLSYTDKATTLTDQGRYQSAGNQLTALDNNLSVFDQDIEALKGADLPMEEAAKQAQSIAARLKRQGDRFEELRLGGSTAPFFTAGTRLGADADSHMQRARALGDRLVDVQRARGVSAVSNWRNYSLGKFPAFQPGYGGAPNEEATFDHALSKGFDAFNDEWVNRAAWLGTLGDVDLGILVAANPDLKETLSELDVEFDGQPFDLRRLMRAVRTAKLTGDSANEARLTRLIETVGNFKTEVAGHQLAVGHKRRKDRDTFGRMNKVYAASSALGFMPFDSLDTFNADIAAYGFHDEGSGERRGPATAEEEVEFLGRVYSAPGGLSRLVNSVGQVMYPEDGPDDLSRQMKLRTNNVLKQLGLNNPTNRDLLKGLIAQATGADPLVQMETLEEQASPLHTYVPDVLEERFNDPTITSDYDLVENPGELLKQTVSRILPAVPELSERDEAFRKRSKDPRRKFTQTWEWQSALPWSVEADEHRMVLEHEAAAETADTHSFRDILDEFQRAVPTVNDVLSSPGRVRDQSFYWRAGAAMPGYGGAGGDIEREKVTRAWARGEARSYITGSDSFVHAYERNTRPNDRDENAINKLGFLDLIRGVALSREAGMSQTDVERLSRVQGALRGMDLDTALRFVGTSGFEQHYFKSDDFGLTPAVAASEPLPPVAPAPVQLDTTAERNAIRSALIDVDSVDVNEAYDLYPDVDRYEFGLVTEPIKKDATTELERRLAQVEILERAKKSTTAAQSTATLVRFILNEEWNTADELAEEFASKMPSLLHKDMDALQLQQFGIQDQIDMLAKSKTAEDTFRYITNIVGMTGEVRAQNAGAGLTSTTEMSVRLDAVRQAQLSMGSHIVEMRALAEELQGRALRNEPLRMQQVPPYLRNILGSTFADELNKQDPDIASLALKLWAADKQYWAQPR